MSGSDSHPAELVRRTEGWFVRRGLPHFIEDYRASEDIYTRALPVLVVVFVGASLNSFSQHLGLREWLLRVPLTLGVLLGGWVLVNRLRRRRLLARPRRIGRLELAAFVLVPPAANAAARHDGQAAVVALAITAGSLGLIYVVTSYGLVPMTRWAIGRTFRQLGDVYRLATRAMPMLLLFITFLFINTEVWQVTSALSRAVLWGTVMFFVVLAVGFLLGRLPEELRRVNAEVTPDFVQRSCAGTPLAEHAAELSRRAGPVPLSMRQRVNLLLVLLFSQAVQVFLLALTVWAFFVAFGRVAISRAVIESWTGERLERGRLFDIRLPEIDGEPLVSDQLLQVSIFLAAFAGLYFTVFAVTDTNYREQFFTQIIDDLEKSVGVRSAYLALRDRAGADGADPEIRVQGAEVVP